MDPQESGRLVAGKGLEGSADFGSPRHVTLIDAARWAEAQERLGAPVDPASRRANLMLSGLNLAGSRGKILRLGTARLEIRGETRPCEVMDMAHQGLRQELQRDWGGGAYAHVLEGAEIRIGDVAAWEETPVEENA
jgi:MOSC domain-containing protein YiiM